MDFGVIIINKIKAIDKKIKNLIDFVFVSINVLNLLDSFGVMKISRIPIILGNHARRKCIL